MSRRNFSGVISGIKPYGATPDAQNQSISRPLTVFFLRGAVEVTISGIFASTVAAGAAFAASVAGSGGISAYAPETIAARPASSICK